MDVHCTVSRAICSSTPTVFLDVHVKLPASSAMTLLNSNSKCPAVGCVTTVPSDYTVFQSISTLTFCHILNARFLDLPASSTVTVINCSTESVTAGEVTITPSDSRLLHKTSNAMHSKPTLPPHPIAWCCQLVNPSLTPHPHMRVARWLSGRASDLRSRGRGFEARPRRCCTTTLGKLFTPHCLCHQAV